VHKTDGTLSVTAVARRLGVSRSMVWRMIADGYLDAVSVRRGHRLVTRVEVPAVLPDEPPGTPARSRTMRLQDQVDALTQTVETLTAQLIEAETEQQHLRQELHRRLRDAVAARPTLPPAPEGVEIEPDTDGHGMTVIPPPNPIPHGITARPNPMTHPETVISSWRLLSREEALAPLRAALDPAQRRHPWWQRLTQAKSDS
jgi:excisionase family DNA binding protein